MTGDVTAKALAELLEVDVRTVARWTREGCPTVKAGHARRYPLGPVLRWWRDRAVAKALAAVEASDPAWRAARARKVEADATLAELDVAVRRGALVPVDTAARQVGAIVDVLRAKLLSFPPRHAPDVVGLRSIPEALAVLEAAIHDAMTALAMTADEDVLAEVGE